MLNKVKVKLSLCLTKHHTIKTYWRRGGIAPRILDLGTNGGEWSALRLCRFTLRERTPWYPLDRRLGVPQSRPGRGGEKENPQPPPGVEP
jgi:hypothetical protein